MGRDKARLLLGSRSFLERIVAVAREIDLPVELITRDDLPALGPIGGVLTAFRRGDFARAVFLSCDMPLITPELLRDLLALPQDRAGFTVDQGRAGFPFILPFAAEALVSVLIERKLCSIQDLCAAANGVLYQPSSGQAWQLANVNTPADYRRILKVWAEKRRSKAVLEVRNLCVQRGGARLIWEFSWKVRKREHWAVLGPNGCGKTSLFSSLLGYVTPTKGDIFVLGEEYGDADWPKLRQKVGLVSSSVRQMMPETEPAWITVASGKYAMIDFWGIPPKKDKKNALALLRRIECEYLADRPWACLSQGERQRVLIARALMAQPALLILDEPCAGLDPAAREHFLSFLDRLGQRRDSPSIVLVTHHVEEVMPVFTHVLLMKAGRKFAEGTVDQMLSSRQLTEAFEAPVKVRKSGGRYALRVRSSGRLIA